MAKLDSESRSQLKDEDFAIPEQRAYPYHDRQHAINAIARSTQHGDEATRAAVRKSVCERYPDLNVCKTDKYKNPLD